MQRRVRRADVERIVGQLRETIPDLVMRTTFITGFPGETDHQFDELVDFVTEQAFERAGVFTYSLEPDTPAARLDGHLPETVKEQRRERLMQAQQQVAFQWCQAQQGKQLDVLIDQPLENETGRFLSAAPTPMRRTWIRSSTSPVQGTT